MTSPAETPVRRYVAFLARHCVSLSVLAFLVFSAAVAVSLRLQLRADLAELLPSSAPAVLELKRIAERVGTPATLVVAIEGPDRAANEGFADALAARLAPMVGRELRGLDYRADAARGFFEAHALLYSRLEDLRRAGDDLEGVLLSQTNPGYIPLEDPSQDLRALQHELEARAHAPGPFPRGYFESEDGRLVALVAWTKSSGTGDAGGFHIRDRVLGEIAAAGPRRFGVRASLTGDVESAIQEHESLKSDVELVSAVCTILVLGVIIAYFRSVLAVPFIFFPTLLGAALAFAVTALAIGYLNTNTAFLGSIILGNGINFGIILLARHREERRRGVPVDEALVRAISQTARPTLVAALAAAIAYASLMVTRFRGFQQFGFVGGIGMILCWLATYSHGPLLILWAERRARRGQALDSHRVSQALAGRLPRRPLWTLAVTAVLTALSLMAIAHISGSPFDYDFRRLRNTASAAHGAGRLYAHVGALFPSDISPIAVALLPRVADAAAFRATLLERDCAESARHDRTQLAAQPVRLAAECARRVAAGEPTGGLLQDVRTVFSVLPSDQPAKLVELAHIRRLLENPGLSNLAPGDRAQLDKWRPPAELAPLGPADLPEALARPYRELDGTVGRVALVFATPRRFEAWDGHMLLRMADLLDGVPLAGGAHASAGGRASVFAAMLRSIVEDGTRASLVALGGVVLLVVLFFRRLTGIALVLGALSVGMLWMAGSGVLLGLRLNFLNFVAVPVTLGIGVDYAVNVYARLSSEPLARYPRALAETGSAVALCSSTTVIGYSSLLIADSGALRSFGKLADVGELGCLLAALLLVPAVLILSRRGGYGSSPTSGASSSS